MEKCTTDKTYADGTVVDVWRHGNVVTDAGETIRLAGDFGAIDEELYSIIDALCNANGCYVANGQILKKVRPCDDLSEVVRAVSSAAVSVYDVLSSREP